jgi:UTP--glucose-1-phosphate uridylyltransferase
MTKVTEKPKKGEAKSDLSPLGRYVCSPKIFDIIRDLKPGASGEYQFTDALDIEAHLHGALAYVFKGTRYDMGDRFGYLKANIEYGLRDEELKEDLLNYLKEIVK